MSSQMSFESFVTEKTTDTILKLAPKFACLIADFMFDFEMLNHSISYLKGL